MLSFLWRERGRESLHELAVVPGSPQVKSHDEKLAMLRSGQIIWTSRRSCEIVNSLLEVQGQTLDA